MTTKQSKFNYQEKNSELEKIIADMQDSNTDIDKSITNYEAGLKIIKELESYLKTAENNIQELKAKFSKDL